jgi:class 3 adenylate cyclase/tetratricopeptide (TPR) repeat protein
VSFLETVEKARALLERNGRVSLRALQREFNLDDGALDELIEELAEVQGVAVRDGSILAWASGVRPAPTGTPEHERAPRDYTPKHLADTILASKSALEGESKQVTVLFADVNGSMELAGQLDPEEWHRILERFFEILAEGVHRFEGTINQYTGDGIMALFGAPIAHEDHAQRACYAALHLRDALRRYADELRLERGLSLATRMGLNSGEVVVGKIGDDLRMDYTAQGQVVHMAQRMEQLAESGRVYLAQQIADRVSGYFRLREVGPTRIKGLEDPQLVYELEDVGEFQSRFDVSRARGLSRFVGRKREMAQLEAALERALRGPGRFVGIVAEAGTGKSRLAYEFARRCQERGLRVMTARCPPHGKNVPMGFQMALARSAFRVRERDDRETARNKVAGQMSRTDPALARYVPFMLDFLGLAEPGSEPDRLEAEARQREFLRITERLSTPEAFQLAVMEDLHWMDPASEEHRVQIGRIDLPNPRLKVLTFRREYRPAEADWPEYEEIRLKPLSAESTTELLRDLLGSDASVRELEPLIQERAAGNPFFVEEIVHSLVESRQLEGAAGAYRLVGAIGDFEVPDSVQAVLAARIDRQDDLAKRTLQAAAIIGAEFPVAVVEEVTGLPQRDVGAALHTLAAADLIYQIAAYPEVEYAFKHPLTQAVAYDTQLGEARRRLHGRVACALASRHEQQLDEKSSLIAYHWEQASEPVEASRWHARAARWLETHDLDEALRHWRTTCSLLRGEAELSSEDAEQGTVACTQILNLAWRQGMDEAEAARVFAEGQEFAARRAGARAHALLLASFATYRGVNHGAEEMLAWNARALELAAQVDDPSLALMLSASRTHALSWAGRMREALELAERTLARTLESGLGEALRFQIHVVSNQTMIIGAVRHWVGRLAEARASLEEAVALARHHRDPDTTCFALQFLAELCVDLGDRELALRHARESVEVADRYTSRHASVWADRGLARVLIACDRPTEACEVLERALATAREKRIHLLLEAELLQLLAEAHLGLRQSDRAEGECSTAIALAQCNGTPLYECDAQLVLARVLLRETASEPETAREIGTALERAADLIEQTGAESRRSRLEELRAVLARAEGDAAGHARHLREAQRLYTEMGATRHAERLERELERLEHPA